VARHGAKAGLGGPMADPQQADEAPAAEKKRRPGALRVVTGIVAVAAAIGALWGALTAVGQAVEYLHKWTAKPTPPPTMLHTPRLGLQFWQGDTEDTIQFDPDSQPEVVRVSMRRAPFEMRFPAVKRGQALQVCAWKDSSIFTITDGEPVEDIPFFSPGTGMAEYEFGSGTLLLDNMAHNYLVDTRIEQMSPTTDRVYFSQTSDVSAVQANDQNPPAVPLTKQASDIYLTLYIDKDNDNVADLGEYEFVDLRFL